MSSKLKIPLKISNVNVDEGSPNVSQTKIVDKQTCLPPFININTRNKTEPEKVDVNDIALQHKKKLRETPLFIDLPKSIPTPKYPLSLIWSPDQMHFDINTDVIKSNLRIWHSSLRSIYVHYCGLWDGTARHGASWYCYPRTRIRIPPGLKVKLTIEVTPRSQSPVPLAYIGLQLAAAHMRDNVTGYFEVPIIVKFSNYKATCALDGE